MIGQIIDNDNQTNTDNKKVNDPYLYRIGVTDE